MKSNRSVLVYIMGFILLSSCIKEDNNSGVHVVNEDNNATKVAPCSYFDEVLVTGYPGMDSEITEVVYGKKSNNYYLLFRFLSTNDYVIIKNLEGAGFQYLHDRVIDFEDTSQHAIIMYIGGTFQGSAVEHPAIKGELYFYYQYDGSLKVDWCDVTFENSINGKSYPSYGGAYIRF